MDNLAKTIQQKTIKKVFDQRADFIVIGLIGAIGSDINSAVDILTSTLDSINLPETIGVGETVEELEYKNIYHFAQKNWRKFDVIKARDIIITYILENTYTYGRFKEDIGRDLLCEMEFTNACLNGLRMDLKNLNEPYLDTEQIIVEINNVIQKILDRGLLKELLTRNDELLQYIDVLRTKKGTEYSMRTTFSLYVYTKYVLPIVGVKIKEALQRDKYTTLFQRYGNEIRFFGTLNMREWATKLDHIENKSNFDYFYSIAKRINTFIKIRRAPSSNKKSIPLQVIIDSLKNPYEFDFLKDRYSAYYTFALLKNKQEQKSASEIFAEDRYAVLYENPDFVKKDFIKFVNILIDYTRHEITHISVPSYQYIQSLSSPDEFIQYILAKLKEFRWDEGNTKVFEEVQFVDYDLQFGRVGISEEEYRYFFDILKDPIRTFCMISGLFTFYLQDIQSSIQNSDILIDTTERHNLRYQLVKYVSLIMHPGLVPPTKTERCMQIAFSAKVNSGCISRQVGAVVTDKDYNILSIGWNDVPYGRIPCVYRDLKSLQKNPNMNVYSDLEREKSALFRDHINRYKFTDEATIDRICNGMPLTYCFKSEYCKITHEKAQENSRAMHGEERAFHSCMNKSQAKGGCLFTTSSSCERCTIIANEYGIKKIYYIEKYPGISQDHVNASGRKENRAEFILFEGAVGVAYVKLYTPILPIKDELQLRGLDDLYDENNI